MGQQFWTYVLNNDSIIINESIAVKSISMVLVSGNGFFAGSINAAGTYPSDNVQLIVNQPVTISTSNTNFIDGVIISTSGIVNIVAF
jgi:hypothetical protein